MIPAWNSPRINWPVKQTREAYQGKGRQPSRQYSTCCHTLHANFQPITFAGYLADLFSLLYNCILFLKNGEKSGIKKWKFASRRYPDIANCPSSIFRQSTKLWFGHGSHAVVRRKQLYKMATVDLADGKVLCGDWKRQRVKFLYMLLCKFFILNIIFDNTLTQTQQM